MEMLNTNGFGFMLAKRASIYISDAAKIVYNFYKVILDRVIKSGIRWHFQRQGQKRKGGI